MRNEQLLEYIIKITLVLHATSCYAENNKSHKAKYSKMTIRLRTIPTIIK